MKTVFRTLTIFILFSLQLFSSVNLNSSNSFIKGEPFIFEFEVSGSSINFPKIEKIEEYVVQNLGTSRSLQIINGKYSEKISQKFQILPQKEFTIPSFIFEIDGIKIESASKKILEKKADKTISDNFDLQLISSKKEAYIGEEILLTLVFKYKKNLQITNLGFEPPHFENFWYKKVDTNRRYEENEYIVQELEYILFAQKSGKVEIKPLSIIVQQVKQDSRFGNFSFLGVPTEKKIYSNPLEFDIKELPENTKLIGEFSIYSEVDKQELKEGESLSLKLNITGVGNFDDIKDYTLELKDAIIYDNKPKIETKYSDMGLEGTYEKIFSIVPSSSLIIPSFTIKYFDKKQNKVIEKRTKEYKILVNNIKSKEEPILEKSVKKEPTKVIEKNSSFEEKLLFFLFGCFVTLLIFGLFTYVRISKNRTKKDNNPLIKKIKSSKNKEELLKILLPYLKYNIELDELIFKCEKTNEFKEIKKTIIALVKQLDIKG
ncbi:BatD family protein [Halarcobacter bivalviorum]|uniref:BatD family protein n=1 Tax=Halarcobacter bivalviorum TaxID=663364 RepID=UPI00100C1C10|nr:BatD family protein [Halarcobacter bivalviorum]RXK05286.1 hypothetical protein CRU97_08040 [Halarcobacter bivalviorum]